MPLYKWVRELVTKFTFVTKTEFKNATLLIYYMKDNKEKFRRLPYRAGRVILLKTLDSIRDEIGYKEYKEEIDKRVREEIKKDEIIFTTV